MKSGILIWLLVASAANASDADRADRAIEPLMKRPGQTVRTIVRTAVSADLDLVIALSNPSGYLREEGSDGYWNRQSRLGVFLQRRTEPAMVYRIAIEEGPEFNEGVVRVERATATDTVVFCIPEKGGGGENLKFVYDIRAKALVKRIAYERFPDVPRVGVGG